jgi:flagellar motor switch protein FliM
MLTQAEIDALLAGAIEIEEAENQDGVNLAQIMGKEDAVHEKEDDSKDRRIRPYNFWSPDRFSKDQMRAVELVHEELAERLTNTLPSFLRTNVRPRIVHTEQGRFHDFLHDLPPNSLYHLVSLAPLPGQLVINLSPEVSFVILEQRLGGRSDRSGKTHILTDIDQSLLQDFVENMLNDLKASWGRVALIEPKIMDSTINQPWVQMMVGNERVMTIAFEIIIKETTGTMSFYIPYSMLKPVINELNPATIITGQRQQVSDPIARQINVDNLNKVVLPLQVILGKSKLTMSELLNLQIGDVIVLDTFSYQDLKVRVAGKDRFRCKAGRVGKNLGIQLTGFEKATEEEEE